MSEQIKEPEVDNCKEQCPTYITPPPPETEPMIYEARPQKRPRCCCPTHGTRERSTHSSSFYDYHARSQGYAQICCMTNGGGYPDNYHY